MRVQVLLLRHSDRNQELPLLQIRDPDTEDNDGGAFEPADFDFIRHNSIGKGGPEGLTQEIDLYVVLL